ncbi:homeobox and c2h2 transcription protein [Stemphylium lycopersici]|nr:homeobox and c2h2 transcription protein [Stemphylium lycopersici]
METDEAQLYQFSTPQQSNSFKRPRRSLQSSTPLSSVTESVTSSPRHSGQNQFAPQLFDHINALKHLDDQQILQLLSAARNGDGMRRSGADRSSMSTVGSRASSYLSVPSSRVPSMLSDPRSSIASTDSSFTHYSAASSRLSTASSRLSTISTASTPAPKNFACTFCDKALKSKPYWKSHEEEFHEQRLTWRCPDCEQIFHAGKRFREHHTKLHGCEHCKQPRESGQPTSRKASPCVKKYEIVMHDKDAWGCGFCAALLTTWEERCEHIALHFEEKGSSKWNFTNVVLGLLKQPEVSSAWNQMMIDRYGDEQNWPALAWESKKCNRLRYKLETKWDTRVFDTDKLVQDTFDLAEIEAKDVESNNEATPEVSEPNDSSQGEMVEFKLETSDLTSDFGADHRLHSSHGLSQEHMMMDIDSVEPPQPMHHQDMSQPQWPVTTDMSHNSMSAATGMDGFNAFDTSMTSMPTDFSQPMAQSFQPQPQGWPNAGFASTPDLLNYQQPAPYMDFQQPKEIVSVPTSQYANFAHYPRQSLPPNFLQQQQQQPQTPSTPTSRRYVPRLINISNNSSHRGVQMEQPPPPPPKDEHQQNRFSRLIMRRRPSNISQHTMVSHRDMGGTWGDELTWG